MSFDKAKLETDQDSFVRLHEALDKTNSTTEFIKVPRDAFARMLRDHSVMDGVLRSHQLIKE